MRASRFRFHPAAEVELDEAARWYEERHDGLGLEFLSVVRLKIAELIAVAHYRRRPKYWARR